ncbi:MAG: abortive infection family protein [bacterium]|nr:abortive infection family protein [Candidatus Colousia faecequi]
MIKTPKVNIVTQHYIRELPNRIKEDLANKDFDSVITKSRTLLEEVLIYIIEKLTRERYKSNGDLVKIYQDATELLNMRQNREWDKRVNELLGGLHKMVSAISSMRNMNSDAHGAGSGRIGIKEREALLAAQSAMMLAEY